MKNTWVPCYKAPRVTDLVRSVEDGKSVQCIIEKNNLKLIVRPYGKYQTLAGLYYDEKEKRKQFCTKKDNEDLAKEEFKKFLVNYVNNICDQQGLIRQKDNALSLLCDEFIEHKKYLNCASATLAAYSSSVDLLIRTIGDKQIQDVAIHSAQDFIKHGWNDEKLGGNSIWKSSATARKHVRHLKIFWNYCIKFHSELISENIWYKVEIPRESISIKPIPSTDELCRIWESIDSSTPKGRTLIRLTKFICHSGLRIKELARLGIADVDKSKKIIIVRNDNSCRTKSRKPRVIPLSRIAAEVLDDQLQDNLENDLHSDLIFPKTSYWTLRTRWDAALTKAGFSKSGLSFHSLRRYFGTKHIQNDTPINHLQKWYGHSDQRTTERYIGDTAAMQLQARGYMDKFADQFMQECLHAGS